MCVYSPAWIGCGIIIIDASSLEGSADGRGRERRWSVNSTRLVFLMSNGRGGNQIKHTWILPRQNKWFFFQQVIPPGQLLDGIKSGALMWKVWPSPKQLGDLMMALPVDKMDLLSRLQPLPITAVIKCAHNLLRDQRSLRMWRKQILRSTRVTYKSCARVEMKKQRTYRRWC